MAQVVVAGVSGAAGVSATALGLAAWWSGGGAVAVECDPSGGNAAARWGVGLRPGLVECAAVAEVGGPFSDPLTAGTQWLSVAGRETAVVCAPPGGRQVATALPLLGPSSKALDPADGTAVVDVGRLWADSPAWPLCESADLLLVIAPASVAGIAHLRAHLVSLVPQRVGATLVALAGGEYAAGEVAGAVADIEGVEVAGELPPPDVIYHRPRRLRGRGDRRRWDAFARMIAERLASVPKAAIRAGVNGGGDGH